MKPVLASWTGQRIVYDAHGNPISATDGVTATEQQNQSIVSGACFISKENRFTEKRSETGRELGMKVSRSLTICNYRINFKLHPPRMYDCDGFNST